MLVAPALAGVSGGLALGGYGRPKGPAGWPKAKGRTVQLGGNRNAQAYGGNSVYNSVGSAYAKIKV